MTPNILVVRIISYYISVRASYCQGPWPGISMERTSPPSERCCAGFDAAAARVQHAAAEKNSSELFIALFEALNWSVVLDDRIATHWRPTANLLAGTGVNAPRTPTPSPLQDLSETECTVNGRMRCA